MPKPPLAAEQEHSGPRDRRIGEGHDGDVGGNGRLRKDQLEPREPHQERERRPHPEAFRVRQAQGQLATGPDAAAEDIGPTEEGAPRIEQGPQVAGEGRDVGQAHPPDDPHQQRRQVLLCRLVADQPGEHDEPQQGHGNQLQDEDDGAMGKQPAHSETKEVEAGIGAGTMACRAGISRLRRRRRRRPPPPPSGRARRAPASRSAARRHGRRPARRRR